MTTDPRFRPLRNIEWRDLLHPLSRGEGLGARPVPALAGRLARLLPGGLDLARRVLLLLFLPDRAPPVPWRPALHAGGAAPGAGRSPLRPEPAHAREHARGPGLPHAPSPALPGRRGRRGLHGAAALVEGAAGRPAVPAAPPPGGLAARHAGEAPLDRGRGRSASWRSWERPSFSPAFRPCSGMWRRCSLGESLTGFFAVWTVHHGCDPHGLHSRTQRGRWMTWISYSMFFHAEHHLFPAVPTCHLARLAERLDAAAPEVRWPHVMPGRPGRALLAEQ